MRKRIFGMLMALVLLLLLGGVSVYGSNNDMDDLKSIINDLISDRTAETARGIDFRTYENIHLHPRYEFALTRSTDPRLALLDEIQEIFREALTLQNEIIRSNVQHHTIISAWGGPQGDGCGTFFVRFSSDDYLALVPILVGFIGITEEMLVIGESGVVSSFLTSPAVIPQYVNPAPSEYLYEAYARLNGIVPLNTTLLQMGTRINFTAPGSNMFIFQTWPTLGHPGNAAGTRAFGTNHGFVPINSAVWIETPAGFHIQIGVARPIFGAALGLDLSEISFINGFSISPRTSLGTNITNFFGAIPSAGQTVRFDGATSGNAVTGRITRTGISTDPINGRIFHGVIEVGATSRGGDSGAGLIHGSNIAVGTLFAGLDDANGNPLPITFVSPAVTYQFR